MKNHLVTVMYQKQLYARNSHCPDTLHAKIMATRNTTFHMRTRIRSHIGSNGSFLNTYSTYLRYHRFKGDKTGCTKFVIACKKAWTKELTATGL